MYESEKISRREFMAEKSFRGFSSSFASQQQIAEDFGMNSLNLCRALLSRVVVVKGKKSNEKEFALAPSAFL
jgi:hypothetical protein